MRLVVALGLALILGCLSLPAEAVAQGRDSIGIVDQGGEWRLTDPVTGGRLDFTYGDPADVPFMGDWDCDGVATPGLYRRSTGQAFLRDENSTGVADRTFLFGNPGDFPLAGDFDGDGCDSLSIYRPAQAQFHVTNALAADGSGLGPAELAFQFGDPGDVPFVGDWDGDGTDTFALRRPSDGLVYMTNAHRSGPAEVTYVYGDTGDVPLGGDWDGDGHDSVGLYRPAAATMYLRNENSTGVADLTLRGRVGSPVAGDFGELPPPPPGSARTIEMVARQTWGARPAETGRLIPHLITRLTIHHAGTALPPTGPAQFRGWQDWHMDGQGWGDLAYHVIIGVDGTVYEGRDPAYRGDTGTSYDTTGHFLVVVEGNFEVDQPTPAQLDSLAGVLAWAAEHYQVPPATISGHGEHAATLCPGGHLESRITSGELRAEVERLIAEGGVGLDWP